MPLWLFIFLAALAVISALGVILQRNPVHSLLALVMTLWWSAIIFIGLGAATVGFLQIIVYVGAIMVLFLFVIWLLNLQSEPVDGGHLALKLLGALASAAADRGIAGVRASSTGSAGAEPAGADRLWFDWLARKQSVLRLSDRFRSDLDSAAGGSGGRGRPGPPPLKRQSRGDDRARSSPGGRLVVPASYFMGLSAVLFASAWPECSCAAT